MIRQIVTSLHPAWSFGRRGVIEDRSTSLRRFDMQRRITMLHTHRAVVINGGAADVVVVVEDREEIEVVLDYRGRGLTRVPDRAFLFPDAYADTVEGRHRRGLSRIKIINVRLPLSVSQMDATSRGTITVTGPSNWVHLDGRKGITIEELTFGALNTRSGPIDVGRAAGKVHLYTHGGNASVRADNPTELLISTGGGDVEVSGQWKEDALDIREEGGKVTFRRG
ncbi:hypothetical protein [Actinomadura sp. NPDC049753]|uniref:hypothetical protein n=1 Tax=Actinomadura sp. NPDC049753 TaxID=3154739 RepID=UPI00342D01AD